MVPVSNGGAASAGATLPAASAPAPVAGITNTQDRVNARGAANPKVRQAIKDGNEAHADFKTKSAAKGWDTNPRLTDPQTGKTVIPDAVTRGGKPVELKPNTPSGRAKGETQLPKYERATGQKGRVVYYSPKPNT